MADFEIRDEELKKVYETKMQKFKALCEQKVDDSQYFADATVKRYAVTMEKVKRLLNEKEIKADVTDNLENWMNQFLDICLKPTYEIALVGAIKAGKSTLINALLGYEYASTEVTPETAALTKFKRANENYVKVSFYKSEEWDELWKSVNKAKASVFLEEYQEQNADSVKADWIGHKPECISCQSKEETAEVIKKWTSAKSPTHYFVKEVEVGISAISELNLPENVILVDTPGLDDVVEYRSDITKKYISRANAVLVCVKADTLTGPEMATILQVFEIAGKQRNKVFILATQLDTLNHPKSDWEKQQAEWLKSLKGDTAFRGRKLAEKNLLSVSAYLFMLLAKWKDDEISDEEMADLKIILMKLRIDPETYLKNSEQFEKLKLFSGIPALETKIKEELINGYQGRMAEEIASKYDNRLSES